MTQPDEILEYLFVKYISGPEFLARLSTAKSQSDIETVLRYSVQDAIRAHGYKADLWYDNVMRTHLGQIAGRNRWSYSNKPEKADVYRDIFAFEHDAYFGEKLNFDPIAFASFIGRVKSASKSYPKIADQVQRFGDAGLRKAISKLASEHKWAPITPDYSSNEDADLGPESQEAASGDHSQATFLLSSTEGERIVNEIRLLKSLLETAQLEQAHRAQAAMIIDATLILSQMPEPNWKMVRELLYVLAAISTVFAAALQIAELIK